MGSAGRPRISSDFDNKTDDEDEKDNNAEKEHLTPKEQLMSDTLAQKRQEVIVSLIESLSSKNKTDLEACLNAHTILTELCENEITFGKVIQRDNMMKLIEAACDLHNHLG